MANINLEKLLNEYPYLNDMVKNTIFVSKEDFNTIKNSDKIQVGEQEVSIEFLKRVLEDGLYYKYTTDYFSNKIPEFNISFVVCGDFGGRIGYSKPVIVRGIRKLLEDKIIDFDSNMLDKYNNLSNLISFSKYEKDNSNKTFSINVDRNRYSIPIEKLIYIMKLPSDKFNELCTNNNIKTIDNIKKEHFIYIAYRYFLDNRLLDKYDVDGNIINNYNSICQLQHIDIESINRHLETKDRMFREVYINNNLKEDILSGMPNDISNLEKAIFIYIKMCKLLTYDNEFYAVNQRGTATLKHKNLDYVETITKENNEIVCYEFNLIYAKLLNELGINFSSDYRNMIGESYGETHANLEFRCDKFLVEADAVTSILQGDMMQAKLNQPLVGLKCKNKNNNTQNEFREVLTKVYKMVSSLENSERVEYIESMDDLLEQYKNITTNIKEIKLNEKLSILIDKVNTSKMDGIDSMSYILQLRKILFNEEERKNNISVSIVRNNKPFNLDKTAMSSAIFTININGFDNEKDNIYYYFNPHSKLINITKEELQDKFNNKVFEYIQQKDPKIPGIIETGGMKK